MTGEPCKRCDGTGYVESGEKADTFKMPDGGFLKTDAPVPVMMPCPKCSET